MVHQNLAKQQDAKKGFQGAPAPGPVVEPGNINLDNFSVPGLITGSTYTAKFTQNITYPGGSTSLESKKTFVAAGSPLSLDPSLVNSVYPPAGHSDYWNVLPHVLFNDEKTPWMLQGTAQDTVTNPTPWLALLVFTEEELTPTGDQLIAINKTLNIPSDSRPSLDRTPTMSYNLQKQDLLTLDAMVCQPVSATSPPASTALQVIFVQPALYAGLFATYNGGSDVDKTKTNPDLTRYKYMSHVRQFNTSGMTNLDASSPSQLAATVCPRTGPILTAGSSPKTAYAHLVSLAGVSGNSKMQFNSNKPAALVSLYSWSFTYLPPAAFSVKKALETLGTNVQPLRNPDAALVDVNANAPSSSPADTWVKKKMLSGYTIIRYRTPTGETTLALLRGFLTAVKFDAFDFPPSDWGSDLAVVDEQTGFFDLTFQLAWELGRTSAIGDRTLSAALARLRKDVHNQALENAKDTLDDTFLKGPPTLKRFTGVTGSLQKRITLNNSFVSQRWASGPTGEPKTQTLSFQNGDVKGQYKVELQNGISGFAQVVPPSQMSSAPEDNIEDDSGAPLYDETAPPQSSDYATLFEWIFDKWYFQGIPFSNLIPDPRFIPKESIRTFFIDQNWFKVFVDGVLSISEHFDEGDDVRESIKKSLSQYLTTKIDGTDFPPQIPKWGFFIRSEFVTKFPDMRISAPFSDADASKKGKQLEVLRMERLDTDIMIAIFDREPSDFSDTGITLTPPEHQLSSMFGDPAGTDSFGRINVHFKNVNRIQDPSSSTPLQTLTFNLTDGSAVVYDRQCQCLCPVTFAAKAKDVTSIPSDTASTQLVASQLVAMVPSLRFLKQPPTGLQAPMRSAPSLSTSKGRPGILGPQAQQPLLQAPPSVVNNPVALPTYPAPVNACVAAIAKVDLNGKADATVISNIFQLPASYNKTPPPTITPPFQWGNNILSGTSPAGKICLLKSFMYNLRYPSASFPINNYPFQTALVSLFPLSLGFTTDLHIPISSVASSPGMKLASVTVSFSVGATGSLGQMPTCVLKPFPNNVATAPTRNAVNEWPLQPNHSGTKRSGLVLPNVRSVGPGRKWNVRTSYTPASGNQPARFDVKLVANNADGYWDINTHREMAIVVEGVQVNCTEKSQGPGYTG